MLQPRDRLIVALDVPSAFQARQVVQTIGEAATTYKIGKQLFTAEGPQVVRDLVSSGRKVFLDLKFHDIPNTVAAAVKIGGPARRQHDDRPRLWRQQDAQSRCRSGGAISPARPAIQLGNGGSRAACRPTILAVTVLTSLSDSDLQEVGMCGSVLSQVLRLGALARAAGCPRPRRLCPGSRRAAPRVGRRTSPSSRRVFVQQAPLLKTRLEWSLPGMRSPPELRISSSAAPSWMLQIQPSRLRRSCRRSRQHSAISEATPSS